MNDRSDWPRMERWATKRYGAGWWNRYHPTDMMARYRRAQAEAANRVMNGRPLGDVEHLGRTFEAWAAAERGSR